MNSAATATANVARRMGTRETSRDVVTERELVS
jgi:hypothetical protein